ncbi:hypothetical protein [Sulfitobacter faviae]|uniref:hypothetical protein n=1 Tax=Sulfitobacter faviae TaxID=1775881 RepID=UPI00398D127F
MSMIEDIKRNREAGTPGPWSAFTDDTGPHTNIVSPTPRTSCVFSLAGRDKRHPDIERVCRVPDMEAALLAAEGLADAVDEWGAKGRTEATAAALNTALGNFRAATEGKA